MGSRGPVGKRSDQQHGHRSKAEQSMVTKAAVTDKVRGPDLTGRHSATARRFWEALRSSGQADFYQDSDWAAAELVVMAIDAFAKKPSAMMLASINSAMSSLLVTEGDRRRVRLELERAEADEEAADVSDLDEHRRRARSV